MTGPVNRLDRRLSWNTTEWEVHSAEFNFYKTRKIDSGY